MRKPAKLTGAQAAVVDEKTAAGLPRTAIENMLGLSSGALAGGYALVEDRSGSSEEERRRWAEQDQAYWRMRAAAARDADDPRRPIRGWRKPD